MTSANCLRRHPKQKFVVTCQGVLVLMCQVVAARLAVVTEQSRLKCISCLMFLFRVKSAREQGITATHSTSHSKARMSPIFWTCRFLMQSIFSQTSREFRDTCRHLSMWVLAMFDSDSLLQLFLVVKRSALNLQVNSQREALVTRFICSMNQLLVCTSKMFVDF